MAECTGVVAGDDKFTADVQAALPDLRVISKWGIGIDGIDLDSAAARGIVVRNTPGMFDDEVADVTMAYITMLARQLGFIDRGIRAGGWPKPPGTSLRGFDARHHRPGRNRTCGGPQDKRRGHAD